MIELQSFGEAVLSVIAVMLFIVVFAVMPKGGYRIMRNTKFPTFPKPPAPPAPPMGLPRHIPDIKPLIKPSDDAKNA